MKVSPLRSLLIDQGVAAPIITAGFVLLHPVLSGKPWNEATTNFKAQYASIMLKGWALWIPAQGINFALIPYQFRILFMQTVALVWNTFLSYISNKKI